MSTINLKPYQDRKEAIDKLERSLARTRDPIAREAKQDRIRFMKSVSPELALATARDIAGETAASLTAIGYTQKLKRTGEISDPSIC